VRVAYLTSGEAGGSARPPEQVRQVRESEATAAAQVLGVDAACLTFLRFPDGGIDAASLQQVGAVMALLRQAQPRLLYVPHPGDASFDHRAAFAVCWRAASMAGSANHPQWGATPHWVPTVLGYEVWSPIADPQYTEDITDVLEIKLRALTCYHSQTQETKGAGQADYVGVGGAALSRFRGAMSTGGHREAFQVLRLGQVTAS
jgi:LmbE family N-acetylglucosaminyl deacetylase